MSRNKKKEEKICSINRVYGIIEFIDKMIKSNKKSFRTFLKLGIKKEELIDLYQTEHICIHVLKTSLSLHSSSREEKGFV